MDLRNHKHSKSFNVFIMTSTLLSTLPFFVSGYSISGANDTAIYLPQSPCILGEDTQYGGLTLNCSYHSIEEFIPDWIPNRTTTIKLNNNLIKRFHNDTFIGAPGLRYIDISSNLLTSLQPEWFRGINSLQVFKAGFNQLQLDTTSFTRSVFHLFPSLISLDLGENKNIDVNGRYPDFLLKGLYHLKELTLDTFATDLQFGSIFHNITTMESLTLTGGMRRIRNDSFQSFNHIPLGTLRFERLDLLKHTETDAFSHLTSLKNLFMYRVKQDLDVTLLSLKPFAGRHFVNLQFDVMGHDFRQMSSFEGKKVITNYNGQYLRLICIEHLSLLSSQLLAISHEVFASETFANCLKSLNLRNNPIHGEVNAAFELIHFHHLKSLIATSAPIDPEKLPTCPKSSFPELRKPINRLYSESPTISYNKVNTRDIIAKVNSDTKVGDYDFKNYSGSTNCTKLLTSIFTNNDIAMSSNSSILSSARCFGISPSINYVFLSDIATNMLSLDYTVAFWPNNLKELYFANNGIKDMSGQLTGLDRLEILDVSYNDAKDLKPYFFDHFPSLKTLIMQRSQLDISFVAKSSSRLFSKLINLDTLDLSDNGLNLFSPDTFKTSKLKVLILAKNRFKSIPFDMKNTPELCLLDLSYNSISALSENEMSQLDLQTTNSNGCFSLALEGNVLSCSCSKFRFIHWLKTTSVQLDHGGNYPCIAENGALSNTSEFHDLDTFWRSCHGQPAFLVSITVLALMLLGFTAAVLLHHFKTRLDGYIYQVVLKKIKPKTHSDYSIGVDIEYSDQDATFVCIPLRSYIEKDLGLTTFVRHRDLLPNQFRDASISQAINRCWRVLLVVTDYYLRFDRWSFYAMKLASSSVTATNQGKVVLLVEAGLEKKIPMCLLKAAQEVNVIVIERKAHEIDSNIKMQLRTALSSNSEH